MTLEEMQALLAQLNINIRQIRRQTSSANTTLRALYQTRNTLIQQILNAL